MRLRIVSVLAPALAALALAAPRAALAQAAAPDADAPATGPATGPVDPIALAAARAPGLRLVVSLDQRMLWLRDGERTVYSTQVAVGKPFAMEYEGRTFRFQTPRGRRRIIAKERNPVWVPPEWHYVEMAALNGWKLARIQPGKPVRLGDGSSLELRQNVVGRRTPDGAFHPFRSGEEIVVDDTLYVPPLGSRNRRVPGELGRFKLDFGDGYYLHGTPDPESIGGAESHGCIRLRDRDLAFLYDNVPVGTPIYIF